MRILTAGLLFCSALFAQQSAGRGFIGVALSDAKTGGAAVGQVQPGGPADKAGLRAGDIVVAIDGRPVSDSSAMTAAVTSMTPGQTAHLSIVRGGQRREIGVTLGTSGGATPAAAPATAASTVSGYTRLTDPIEQAFTVDVPNGWRSEAGMARWSALQIDPYVRSLSPDKMTYLMIGDPSLPSYAPPTDVTRKLGFREGSLHDAGLGGRSLILHYLTGADFARVYGQTTLAGLCPGLRFVAAGERPDLAKAAESQWPTVIPSRSTGGEAVFACTHNKQEMEAKVEAATRTTRDNVIWSVILLQGYIAPKTSAGAAQATLTHMVSKVSWTPAWTQKQNNLSQQAAIAINQRAQESLRREQGFIQKFNAVDQNFASMDEIVSGFSSYRDSQTGNTYSLSNTNPFKWTDDSGRIVSTPNNVAPPWGAYRPLQHTQ